LAHRSLRIRAVAAIERFADTHAVGELLGDRLDQVRLRDRSRLFPSAASRLSSRQQGFRSTGVAGATDVEVQAGAAGALQSQVHLARSRALPPL
jgi:hypothetical protein